jgi:tripartite-type tricarboxylate transporter receptor subunit TctC
MLKSIAAAAIALTFGAALPAYAQGWPTRPLTMVVPYAAGGPVDTIGRILAARLSEILGQQVIVENIGGAGGMTGSARVVKANADGYTFLFGGSAVLAQVQTLYKKPLYDAVADFTPVALLTDSARVLITRKDFPAKDLAEFVAYTKANAAKLQYGSAGAGSGTHVCALLLDQAMGARVTHVPYRGAGPAMQDLLAGRIDYMCEQISTAVPQIEARNVKALALLGPDRVSILPDLPAMKENGFPDFDCGAWTAFVAPRGTPEAIVERLAVAANETVETPAVRERLAKVGVTIVARERRGPEYLTKYIPSEIARWAVPIKASGAVSD